MDNGSDEYEYQLFGFSTQQMKLENSLMVLKVAEQTTDKLLHSLVSKQKIGPAEADKLKKMLLKKVCDQVSPKIRQMDALIQKSFEIPENVLLEEYLGDEKFYTKEEEDQWVDECKKHEIQFKQNAILMTIIERELEGYKKLEPLVAKETLLSNKVRDVMYTEISLKTHKDANGALVLMQNEMAKNDN